MRNLAYRSAGVFLAVAFLAGCQSAYYSSMEYFGKHKRDILVDRVEDARDSQEEAKEQFASALERFTTVMDFSGGDLEQHYDRLNTAFDRSVARSHEVKDRIASVEDVAQALFKEWEKELKDYTSDSLREQSRKKLDETRGRYGELITLMKRAESRMDPVLNVFRDNVLFLKHNLNAQAIASLDNERIKIETDVQQLIKEMEASIREADAFINQMAGSA